MARRLRLTTSSLALLALAGATFAACGSDDAADPPAADGTVIDEAVEPAESESTGDDTSSAPADDGAGAFDDVDDVCSLVDAADLEAVMGIAVPVVSPFPSGCIYSNDETGSDDVSVTLALVPTEYGGTLLEGCVADAALYADAAPWMIGEYPAFTGIDQGSTDFTAKVCAPGFQLTVGGSLTRDQAKAIAELATASS